MKKIDRTALWVILVISILLLVVIVFQTGFPIRITLLNPEENDGISPYASLSFKFSQAVDPEKVAESFTIKPDVPGQWVWADNQNAIWYASTPLHRGDTINFYFEDLPIGENQQKPAGSARWETSVRPAAVVYLSVDEVPQLWKLDPDNPDNRQQMTDVEMPVLDYVASPDGSQIVYSVANSQGGADLWIMDRQGEAQRILLDCGADICSSPAWSLLTAELVFTRQRAVQDAETNRAISRLWLLDLHNETISPLLPDVDLNASDPMFSPNGQWISFWNEDTRGIQLVNRRAGETFLVEGDNGNNGSWEPDSQSYYFQGVVVGETHFQTLVYKTDLASKEVTNVAGGNLDTSGFNYKRPTWNPRSDSLAVFVQPNLNIPTGEIFLISPQGEYLDTIYNNYSKLTSFYDWFPDGETFLFKTCKLSSQNDQGNIVIWNLYGNHEITELDVAANMPAWLP